MSFADEFSDMREGTIKAFREANSTSPETAKRLEDIYPGYKDDGNFRVGIKYLKSNGYLKRKSGLYYLDENALESPARTQVKRTAKIFFITLGLMIVAVILIVLLAK